jgi:hypothetical protein
VKAARDRGVSVAFLGANAVFWHIRLEAGPVADGADRADRLEVNCKRQFEHPFNGHTGRSGAGVFDAGTSRWVAALCGPGRRADLSWGSRMIQAVTLRLPSAMADGRIGRVHRARGNLAVLHAYPGDPFAAHAAG